jgi:hypothetical protein
MKIARSLVIGWFWVVLVAAQPAAPPPSDNTWLNHLGRPVPDPASALPWLRPNGHF